MTVLIGGEAQKISEYYEVAKAAAKDLNAPQAVGLPKNQLEYVYKVLTALHAIREEAPQLQRNARDSHLQKFDEISKKYGDQKMQQAIWSAAQVNALTIAMKNTAIGGVGLFPPIVGLVSSYEEGSKDISQKARRQEVLLDALAGNTSTAAKKIVHDAHEVQDLANKAALTATKSICAGKIVKPGAELAVQLAKVHHLEGLNALLKECESPEILDTIIHFLVAYCPDLRQLDFSSVKILTLEHLRKLIGFRALDTLLLAKANIDDTHVAALAGLQLKRCDLSDTFITGSTLHILHRGIEDLGLSYCRKLTDAGVGGLGHNRQALHEAMQLKRCNLSGTSITGSTLHTLHRGIEDLNISACQALTDAGVGGLGHNRQALHEAMQLRRCNLSGTSITGSTLHTLHRGIEDLSLGSNRRLTDVGVGGLGRRVDDNGQVLHEAMRLKRCDLGVTSITGSTLHTFHRGIEDLDMYACGELTDEGVEGLGCKLDANGQVLHEAMRLKRCNLSSTFMIGSTLHTLHRGIEDLNMRACAGLTDEGVEGLGCKLDANGQVLHEAIQLKRCDLSGTCITGSTLNTFYRGIEDLNLARCEYLTDEGVEGLGRKLGGNRQVLREAMRLKRCDLRRNNIAGSTLHTLHRGIEDLNLGECANLTDAGVEGLEWKFDAHGQLLREAMQLKKCVLPNHISQALKDRFMRAG